MSGFDKKHIMDTKSDTFVLIKDVLENLVESVIGTLI